MVDLPSDPSVSARVEHLLAAVSGCRRALIFTHDNPDPDSIASAFALGRLLEQKQQISFVLAYGGVLGRAENRAMVRLLKIPLVPLSRVDPEQFDIVGLVDTQLDAGNHSLDPAWIAGKRFLCIDHHPARDWFRAAQFADVGGECGATSTLLTAYCDAAEVPLDASLASALFYGIKTDTRDLGRESSDADAWAYGHLVARTDMALLSSIEYPRLPRSYFGVLMRAFASAQVYGNVVACDLGVTYIPDIVSETADRLVAAEGLRWAIVVGEYEDHMYASIRVNDRRYSAGKLVREVIGRYPLGSAGGHGSMAGARIAFSAKTMRPASRTRARRRLLKELVYATGASSDTVPEPFTPRDLSKPTRVLEQPAERPAKANRAKDGPGADK